LAAQRLPALKPEGRAEFCRSSGQLVREKLPLFLFVFASAWVTVYAQHKSGAVATSSGLPLRFRLPNAVYSYLLYIFKGIWPVKLAVFYPNPEGPLPLWKPILASLFLIGVTVLVWRYRDKRYLLTGWLWYLGTLVPVIGIIQVGRQALADRYVYLPFIGLFVKIVWGTAELVPIPARRRILVPVTAITLTAFATLTWWQTTFWESSITLFTRALQVTENNYMAENNPAWCSPNQA